MTIVLLLIGLAILIFLLKYVLSKKNRKQMEQVFVVIFSLLIIWIGGLIAQIICSGKYNINSIYFDYVVYIGICFLPVAFLFLSLIFARTKIKFKKKYALLTIIPIVSLILLWTNDFHHLFYEKYSTNLDETIYGKYFIVHSMYCYILYGISLFILLKYSIKNAGFFSKQALLILFGTLIPIVANVLGYSGIIAMSIYVTPITFTFLTIFYSLAILKFDLFRVTPIALQRIVDRISDSYLVLNENDYITDFNQTFIDTFKIKENIRGKDFREVIKLGGDKGNIKEYKKHILNVTGNDKTENFEVYIEPIEKYFNVEISSIIANNQFLGILILFKDITQHKKDMQIIQNNQEMLVERERLASLGQMVGGIAHSLKTPIFALSGGIEGLNDLIKEFDESIEDPDVNNQDMHDIASDMKTWTGKMKDQLSYMSEVITTVKGQAVNLSGDDNVEYTIGELFSHVNILMKHELQAALIKLNIENNVSSDIILYGNINNLIQVLNNLISNAREAYDGIPNQEIDLGAKLEDDNIVIFIKDFGPGIPDSVKDKLFKEMITTKGKEGTGLGLFMSYSMIKAKFNGDIKYETSKKGTEFRIYLPINSRKI